MSERPELRVRPERNLAPLHPGAVLADILLDVGQPKVSIAERLGISRQYLHAVIEGLKPLSPPMAVRIAKVFGSDAAFWLRLQANHDAWYAERSVDVSKLTPIAREPV